MKCELCGHRTAVIFVQQLRGDVRTEIRLCAECAKERGLDKDGGAVESLAKLLASFGEPKKDEKPSRSSLCPVCGASPEEIKKTGQAGCPACWDLFGPELLRRAYPNGGKSRHVGRLPSGLESYRSVLRELDSVRGMLKSALDAEDYETAARCRDRIKELENGGGRRA
jgi:protein arginine kinase activator